MRVNQDVGYVGDNKSSQHVSKNIIDDALENEGDARELENKALPNTHKESVNRDTHQEDWGAHVSS